MINNKLLNLTITSPVDRKEKKNNDNEEIYTYLKA